METGCQSDKKHNNGGKLYRFQVKKLKSLVFNEKQIWEYAPYGHGIDIKIGPKGFKKCQGRRVCMEFVFQDTEEGNFDKKINQNNRDQQYEGVFEKL